MKFNKNILSIIISVAFTVQLIIISYNHFTGYHTQENLITLVVSLLFAGSLTSLGALFLFYIDFKIVNYCNLKYSWAEKLYIRIPLELILSIIVVSIPAISLTVISNSISPYDEGLQKNIINNILITIILNIIIISGIEAYVFYKNWKETQNQAQELERQNILSQLESLKNQLNPHFLFNSLNVLSSLIEKDKENAQKFINEFSNIYRYVLETSDFPVVELTEELNFCQSFLKLQKYRFSEGIEYTIDLICNIESMFVPPLSVQLTVENAVKHNIKSKETPLRITIYCDNPEYITVKNNYQPRNADSKSTGTGLKNLKKRYSLLTDKKPKFAINDGYYFSILPVIYEE